MPLIGQFGPGRAGLPGGKPPKKTRPKIPPTGPRTGFVVFESFDPHYVMECLIGDGTANPTGGYGGWEVKPRARRRGLTRWTGNEPLVIDIPILIDYFVEGDGKQGEKDIRSLEKMAGLEAGMEEPPLIQFDSGGVVPHDRHDAPHVDWVIERIEWGDGLRGVGGNRQRQAAVVTVRQYIEDDNLHNESAAQRRRRRKKNKRKKGKEKKGSKVKEYTVKKGDTLAKIAARYLGSSKRWQEIAKLNGIRDPNRLTAGQKLRLP